MAERGGRVVLACHEPLTRLLSGVNGVAETVALGGEIPKFDCHAALASVPHILGVHPDNMPSAEAYLPPPTEPWQLDAPTGARLKVGFALSGSPANEINRRRSCAIDFLAPLFARDDIVTYGLQIGSAAAIGGLDLVI